MTLCRRKTTGIRKRDAGSNQKISREFNCMTLEESKELL